MAVAVEYQFVRQSRTIQVERRSFFFDGKPDELFDQHRVLRNGLGLRSLTLVVHQVNVVVGEAQDATRLDANQLDALIDVLE